MPPSLQQRDTARKHTRHKHHVSEFQISKLSRCHFSSEAAFEQRVATQDDPTYNWSRRWSYPPMNPVLDSGAFVNPFTRFPGLFKSVSASVKVEPLSGKGPGVVGSTTRWKQYAASRSGESKESALRRVKRDAGLGRRTLRVRFAEPIVASEHPAQNGSGTDKDAGVDRRTRRVKSTKPASVWEDPTQNGGVTEAGVDRSARRARLPEPSVVVESLTQNAGVAENDAASDKNPRHVKLAKTAIVSEDTAQDGGITDHEVGADENPHNVKPAEPAVVSEDSAQKGVNTDRETRGAEQNDFQRLADETVQGIVTPADVSKGLRAAWIGSIGRTKRWILDPRLRGGGIGASKMDPPNHANARGHSTSAMRSQAQAPPATTSPFSATTSSTATITTASTRLPADVDSSSKHRPVSSTTTKSSTRTLPISNPGPTEQSEQKSAGSRTPEASTGARSPSTPKGSRATQSPPNDARAEPNLFTDFDPRSTIQLNMDTIQAARTLAPGTSASARLIEILEADNERMMKQYLDHVEQFNRTAALRQRPDSNCNTPIDQHRQCRQCGKSITGSDAVCECYGLDDPYDAADEAENKKQEQQQRRNEERKRELVKLLKMTQMKAPGGDGAKKE